MHPLYEADIAALMNNDKNREGLSWHNPKLAVHSEFTYALISGF